MSVTLSSELGFFAKNTAITRATASQHSIYSAVLESMRVLIALLLAQASAFLYQPHQTLHTSLRSDPRDEAIEVEAYVEDLIENITGDAKKAKQDEEINQKSVDAMIDSAIGSDDDPFKDIPKATGLLDNL